MGAAVPLDAAEAQPPLRVREITWRLVLAAVIAGGLSALAAALVRLGFRGLQWLFTGSAQDLPAVAATLAPWRRVVTPVAGAAFAMATLAYARRRARQHGHELPPYVEYVEAVQREGGRIPLKPNLWRTGAAAFSVATGAAVGREGSMIQFAATVASVGARAYAHLLGPEGNRVPLLVACGVAGGVTAAYNAPLAGLCFAAEIAMGRWAIAETLLLAAAALCASGVSGAVLGSDRLYPLSVLPPHLDWRTAALLGLAIAMAFAGPPFLFTLGAARWLRKLPGALLLGAVAVGGLSLLEPGVWGNGDAGLRFALGITAPAVSSLPQALLLVLVLRTAATLLCVWTGTVGGVFTPTLFAGACAGALLALVLPGADRILWAVAGMSLLMSAVTHAPCMASCIAVELTGSWHLLPLLLPLNVLTWGIARKLSARAMYAIASQAPHPTAPDPAETGQHAGAG